MRKLIITACVLVSLAALLVTFGQRRELTALKLEENRLRQQAAEAKEPIVQPANIPSAPPPQHSPSKELLRLRGKVGQLERRKRELAVASTENEKLRNQLASKATNTSGGIALPAGYIRKADAKPAGFNTPEGTIQSMLWAIQNADAATFCQVFNPETAKHMEQEIQRRGSAEEFFKEANVMPGLRILKKTDMDNGEVELTIEVIPGEEFPRPLYLRNYSGQWKLVSGL